MEDQRIEVEKRLTEIENTLDRIESKIKLNVDTVEDNHILTNTYDEYMKKFVDWSLYLCDATGLSHH